MTATVLTRAVLAVALLASLCSCGSRASDEEIAQALGRPAAVADTSVAATDTGAAAPSAAGDIAQPTADSPAGQLPVATAPRSGTAPATKSRTPGAAHPDTVAPGRASTGTGVANKSVVSIAALGTYSGVLGAISSGGPKTIAAWAAETNAHGGVAGHPVKFIVADDQGDPATALTLAKRLVESDHVLAFVGNVNFFGYTQIESYLRTKNVPIIGGGQVEALSYQSPVTFPITAPVASQIVTGLQTFVDKGARKIAILYCLEASALCGYLNDETVKSPQVGKYIVQSYQVSLVAPSYTSQCLRMKKQGVEVVFQLLDAASSARAVADCNRQGFTPATMMLGLVATKDVPSLSSLAATLIPGANTSPAAALPALAKYHQVMATYAPNVGDSGVAVEGWAQAELFGLVARNLSDNPSAAELMEALWKVRNETLGGLSPKFSFSKGGNPQIQPCVFMWGIANKQFSAPNGAAPTC
jgi:branched-chain amino acid transport system substrate-binding protein